ncbi:MAG: hypothetical protein ACYTHM_18790 [Planctomycetota bacterium]|jgi:hypothetical protein
MKMISFLVSLVALAWALGPFAGTADGRDADEKVSKGSDEIFVKRLGYDVGSGLDGYDPTTVTYFLHVPDDYVKTKKHPLLLAISPSPNGRGMYKSWTSAAKTYGFLFACPNKAGNPVPSAKRGQMVVDTLFDVRSKYTIDPDRIFITGFSGGGRMSTGLVKAFPDLFAGSIPIGGIFMGNPNDILTLKTRLGFYLFAGETCFNRKESEKARDMLEKEGIPVELMIGEGMGHTIPKPEQGLKIYEWFFNRLASAILPGVDLKTLTKPEKGAFKKIAKAWAKLGSWAASKKLKEQAEMCAKRGEAVCPSLYDVKRLKKTLKKVRGKPRDGDLETWKTKHAAAAEDIAALYDELAGTVDGAEGEGAKKRAEKYRLASVELAPTKVRWDAAFAIVEKVLGKKERVEALGLIRLLKGFKPAEAFANRLAELEKKAKRL